MHREAAQAERQKEVALEERRWREQEPDPPAKTTLGRACLKLFSSRASSCRVRTTPPARLPAPGRVTPRGGRGRAQATAEFRRAELAFEQKLAELQARAPPPLPPFVLIGHAASLTPY